MTCRFKHYCGAYKDISVYCSYLSRFCQEHKAFELEELDVKDRLERLKAKEYGERLLKLAGRERELFYEKGLDGVGGEV